MWLVHYCREVARSSENFWVTPSVSDETRRAREAIVNQPEPRSRLSIGIQWASRISTIGLEFALPPLLGAGLDRWWGTSPLATLVGAVVGFAVGMMHLLRIAREGN